jgi:hypothetical protein
VFVDTPLEVVFMSALWLGVVVVVFVFLRVRTGLSNTTDPVALLCNETLPVPDESEALRVASPVEV